MQKTSFFPPFIRTLSVLFIGTLLALVLARGAMLGILWPEVAGNPASDILNALVHRYEVRYSHGRTRAHPHCAHPRDPAS